MFKTADALPVGDKPYHYVSLDNFYEALADFGKYTLEGEFTSKTCPARCATASCYWPLKSEFGDFVDSVWVVCGNISNAFAMIVPSIDISKKAKGSERKF